MLGTIAKNKGKCNLSVIEFRMITLSVCELCDELYIIVMLIRVGVPDD